MRFPALALALSLIANLALAHPGRLDSNGGHTDQKTGVYHYHRVTGASQPAMKPATPVYVAPKPAPVITTPKPAAKPKASSASVPSDYASMIAGLIEPEKLAMLKARGANPRVQKATALLGEADLEGFNVAIVSSNAVVIAGYTNAQLAAMTRSALVRNHKIASLLGVFTSEGFGDMREGQSPKVMVGPYAGQELSVDHIVPFAIAPELDSVIANLELLPLDLNKKKSDSIGDRQRDMARRFRAAGLITQARLDEILKR